MFGLMWMCALMKRRDKLVRKQGVGRGTTATHARTRCIDERGDSTILNGTNGTS